MAEPERRLPPRPQRTLGRPKRAVVREDTTSPFPGYLCEQCLDAPAVVLVPAPGGCVRPVSGTRP